MEAGLASLDSQVPQLPAGVAQDKYNDEVQAVIQQYKPVKAEDLKKEDVEKLIGVCPSCVLDPD
jgi:hypothetical protein